MATENTIHALTIPRYGEIKIVRVVDFEKIAAVADDGRISVADLRNAGDFVVSITPSGRNPTERRIDCDDASIARAFCDGFVAAATLKVRAPKTAEEKAAAKAKREAARTAKAAKPLAKAPAAPAKK